jgi:hypothetical protein
MKFLGKVPLNAFTADVQAVGRQAQLLKKQGISLGRGALIQPPNLQRTNITAAATPEQLLARKQNVVEQAMRNMGTANAPETMGYRLCAQAIMLCDKAQALLKKPAAPQPTQIAFGERGYYGRALEVAPDVAEPSAEEVVQMLENMTQYEAEDQVAAYYDVPLWAPVMIRVLYDYEFDEELALENPLEVFGSASKAFENFLNHIVTQSPDAWRQQRKDHAVKEFMSAVDFANNEMKALLGVAQGYEPRVINAAQIIARDTTRRVIWYVITEGKTELEVNSQSEWDCAWVASTSDIAAKAAIEVLAHFAGEKEREGHFIQPIEGNYLALLGTSFEALAQ